MDIKLPVKLDGKAAGADGQGYFLVDADDKFIAVVQDEYAGTMVNLLNSANEPKTDALIAVAQAKLEYLITLADSWPGFINSGIPIFQNLDDREKALMRIAYHNGGHAVADFFKKELDKSLE